ncbi:MAG: hypothetical protein ABSB61_04155 [Anaerolineales bacterium]|jgi:hypothetical protein
MALIVGVWVIAFLCWSGVGALVGRLLGARTWNSAGPFTNFWIGWAATIGLLQLWNLWLPVSAWALAVVLAFGLAGIALLVREHIPSLRQRVSVHLGLALVWLLLAGISALQASGPLTEGDSGDYHLGSVAWAKAYPLVKGLGNLFPRLAFNQSIFLYAALLDVGPFVQNSYQLTNGLLEFVLVGQCLWALWHLLRDWGQARLGDLFFSLMIGPVLIQITDERFRSLSPDPAMFFLGVALFGAVVDFLFAQRDSGEASEPAVLRILLMAAIGVVCKLSFIGFAVAASLIAVGVYWKENRAGAKRTATFLIARCTPVVALIMVPWVVRGALLSGYPAFPSTIGALPVEWRVPAVLAREEFDWIQLRARNPNIPAEQVTANRNWIGPWIKSLPNSVVKPLEIAACLALFLALALRRAHWRGRSGYVMLLPIIPIVSLLAWFFMAPAPRFAGASFWILLVAVMLVAAVDLFDLAIPDHKLAAIGLCLVFFIWVSPFTSYQPPARLRDILVPTRTVRVPSYQTIELASGDKVNVASAADGCWDIPLPCTSEFHPSLELLTPGRVAGGFRLAGSQ